MRSGAARRLPRRSPAGWRAKIAARWRSRAKRCHSACSGCSASATSRPRRAWIRARWSAATATWHGYAANSTRRWAARGAWVIPAACFSYTAGIPYAAWGEWLKSLCGIISGDADELRERKIAERLHQLGPGMADWLPLLGDLVRLDVPENRLTRGLDPQMRQTRRFELLGQL